MKNNSIWRMLMAVTPTMIAWNSVTIGWPHHIAIAAASGSTARSFFAD